jgi:hypothetical protein
MTAQQGGGLEDEGRVQEPTTVQEQRAEPEEQTVGGAKIGRSSPRPLHDQELLLEEQVLREHNFGPTTDKESGETGQQTRDQPEQAIHVNHFAQKHHQGNEGPTRFSGHSNCEFAMNNPLPAPPICCKQCSARFKNDRPVARPELPIEDFRWHDLAGAPAPNRPRGFVAAERRSSPPPVIQPTPRQTPPRAQGRVSPHSSRPADGVACLKRHNGEPMNREKQCCRRLL